MYSYNNLIAKKEPRRKELIEKVASLIDDHNNSEPFRNAQLVDVSDETELSSLVKDATTNCTDSATTEAARPPQEENREHQRHRFFIYKVPRADVIFIDNFLKADECDAISAAGAEVGYSFWAEQPAEADEEGARSNPHCPEQCTDTAGAIAFRTAYTIEACFPHMGAALSSRLTPLLQRITTTVTSYNADMPHADLLYERDIDGTWQADSVNSNMLVARYGAGGHFAPHVDGTTIVDFNTRSLYTALIYLNDVRDGSGGTRVFDCEQHEVLQQDSKTGRVAGKPESDHTVTVVQPCRGRLALFYHNIVHEGVAVGEGLEKRIMRCDVLYKRVPPIGTEIDNEAFAIYTAAREAESSGDAMKAMTLFRQAKRKSALIEKLYQL